MSITLMTQALIPYHAQSHHSPSVRTVFQHTTNPPSTNNPAEHQAKPRDNSSPNGKGPKDGLGNTNTSQAQSGQPNPRHLAIKVSSPPYGNTTITSMRAMCMCPKPPIMRTQTSPSQTQNHPGTGAASAQTRGRTPQEKPHGGCRAAQPTYQPERLRMFTPLTLAVPRGTPLSVRAKPGILSGGTSQRGRRKERKPPTIKGPAIRISAQEAKRTRSTGKTAHCSASGRQIRSSPGGRATRRTVRAVPWDPGYSLVSTPRGATRPNPPLRLSLRGVLSTSRSAGSASPASLSTLADT